MNKSNGSAGRTLTACCMPIFWCGAIGFGYPGIMSTYWQDLFGASSGQTGLVVTIMLLSISVATFFTGKFLNRFGMRSCLLTGTVLMLAAMVIQLQASNIYIVYLWGLTVNLGSSFIYGPALTTMQLALPHRKGLASGLLNLTFGLSGAIMTPIWEGILHSAGAAALNLSLIACIVITNCIALLLLGNTRAAKAGYAGEPVPAQMQGHVGKKSQGKMQRQTGGKAPAAAQGQGTFALTASEAVRTRSFWLIWLTWAFVGAAGISMVTLSKSYAIWLGLSGVTALMAFNLTNGISRIIAGWLCDAIGGERTALISFLITAAGYILLPFAGGMAAICILVACIGYGFGTMFAITGPVAAKHFGMKHFAAIFGLIFTAYGCVGGIIGPLLAGVILERAAGPYRIIFAYLAVFAVLGAGFMFVLGRTKTRAEMR